LLTQSLHASREVAFGLLRFQSNRAIAHPLAEVRDALARSGF